MTAYYNEIDPYAAQWLRNLIAAGRIAPGDVDERDIRDVRPSDLVGYTQCHFFAGIGVWSGALRRAGISDDTPVWTGSCPCQPFSAAGKRGGTADERHLWPAFHWLIDVLKPPIVMGEQVASKDGLGWFDLVSADLEGSGYAWRATDLCAAGCGAPHIRQRLWWVGVRLADATESGRLARRGLSDEGDGRGAARVEPRRLRDVGGLADADEQQQHGRGGAGQGRRGEPANGREVGRLEHSEGDGRVERRPEPSGRGSASGCGDGSMADASSAGLEGRDARSLGAERSAAERGGEAVGLELPSGERREWWETPAPRHDDDGEAPQRPEGQHGSGLASPHWHPQQPGPTNGFWRDADWLLRRDGKWRPVEPGTFPLAHGAPARVGRLRAYGNAIVAQAAETFIRAVYDI